MFYIPERSSRKRTTRLGAYWRRVLISTRVQIQLKWPQYRSWRVRSGSSMPLHCVLHSVRHLSTNHFSRGARRFSKCTHSLAARPLWCEGARIARMAEAPK